MVKYDSNEFNFKSKLTSMVSWALSIISDRHSGQRGEKNAKLIGLKHRNDGHNSGKSQRIYVTADFCVSAEEWQPCLHGNSSFLKLYHIRSNCTKLFSRFHNFTLTPPFGPKRSPGPPYGPGLA